MTPARHGTAATYRARGCRCLACCDAHTDYMAELRQRLNARLAADPAAAPHGRSSTYGNWGCRCPACTAANAAACAEYRQRRRKEDANA